MKPDALRMLARQLRADPNPDAIEDAAAALEACARERENGTDTGFACHWTAHPDRAFEADNPGSATHIASEPSGGLSGDLHRKVDGVYAAFLSCVFTVRRTGNPVASPCSSVSPRHRMLRAAFASALSAWPQATQWKTACERRERL